MKQKVIRTGNSLAVVVPAGFIKKTGIKAGDEVIVETDFTSISLSYKFPNPRQLQLQE